MAALIFAALILVVDQLSKAAITGTMLPAESIPVLPGIFHVTYVQNYGAAFGILAHQRWFFVLAGIFLIAVFLHYYPRLRSSSDRKSVV